MRTHEGPLTLDHNNRYYIAEPDRPASQAITLTSGCTLEVLFGTTYVSGHVEGDGEDYWLFMEAGGKLKLADGMVVRYMEPCCYAPYMDDKPVSILGG